MYYVYIIKSRKDPNRTYIGITNNLKERMAQHNKAPSNSYTQSYAPWSMLFYAAFIKQEKASEFEKYLKTHSGRAFTKKHFA